MNILLTTDFSDNSNNAIEYAIGLFGLENVKYTLLNTYIEPRSSTSVVVSLNEFLQKESIEGLQKMTKSLQAEFGKDLIIKQETKYGDLSSVVNTLADAYNYDYLVIGSKGASAIENFIMGSNTIDVVKSVKLPTLVVPSKSKFKGLKSVALAADYEHLDHVELLEPLANIVRRTKSELSIVNVHLGKEDTDYDHATEAWGIHNVLQDVKHSFETVINHNVAEGIDEFILERDIELIAMIARKHSFWERLFRKSVTKEVSMGSDIPMLVLHEG